MHEPLYRQSLRQSWDLTWHHKWLWIFGLFATFLGQFGLLELLTKVGTAGSTFALYPTYLALPRLIKLLTAGGIHLPIEGWVWLVWLIAIFLGILLLLVYTAVSSQGALIRASAQFAKNKTLPHLGNAWAAGTKHFWRLFFINLVKKIIFVFLAVMVGWGTLAAVNHPMLSDLFLFLIVFIVATGAGILVSFLTLYTACYVVVEDYSFVKAVRGAWNLFLSHWLVSIEVGLLILLLNVVITLVAVFGLVICLMPAIVIWFMVGIFTGIHFWIGGVILAFLFGMMFIFFLGSFFSVFITSVWTYLFTKMHHEGIKSRIVHMLTWTSGK